MKQSKFTDSQTVLDVGELEVQLPLANLPVQPAPTAPPVQSTAISAPAPLAAGSEPRNLPRPPQ